MLDVTGADDGGSFMRIVLRLADGDARAKLRRLFGLAGSIGELQQVELGHPRLGPA